MMPFKLPEDLRHQRFAKIFLHTKVDLAGEPLTLQRAQGFIIERQQASGVAHQLFAFRGEHQMAPLFGHQRRTALTLQLFKLGADRGGGTRQAQRCLAKLPHSMPVTKLRRASRSSPGKRFSIIIPIFRTFILNVVIFEIVLWHRERQGSTGPAKRALAVRKEIKKPIRTLSAYCRQG